MKLKSRFVVEAMGSPADLVVKTLEEIVKAIKNTYTVIGSHISKPEKAGEQFHTAFIEVTIEFKNIEAFFEFMMNYTPSFVEVLEPYKLELSAGELESISNNVMTKIHQYDKSLKSVSSVNRILTRKLEEKK
jgi:hypothetical protein